MCNVLYLKNTYISSWKEFVELTASVMSSDTRKAKITQEEIFAALRDGTLHLWASNRVDDTLKEKLAPENYENMTDSELLQSIRDICGCEGCAKRSLRFEDYLELIDEIKIVEDGKEKKYKFNDYIWFSREAKARSLTLSVKVIEPVNDKIELWLVQTQSEFQGDCRKLFSRQNVQTVELRNKGKIFSYTFDISNITDGDKLYLCADDTVVRHLNRYYELNTFNVKGVKFKVVKVDAGSFTMGATAKQQKPAYGDEYPAHKVTLSGYYIGEVPVTQELWQAVMGYNPSHFKGENNPVDSVSWNACNGFINKLNELTKNKRPKGMVFRLPTEAEWEYAARGGASFCNDDYMYSGSDDPHEVAWFGSYSSNTTHPVGRKNPNQLGIYDMSGNVWEWCYDGTHSYDSNEQTNPVGSWLHPYRVLRGGGWFSDAGRCRVSCRSYNSPGDSGNHYGLRLCLGRAL